jgi:DNA replication protein DnaC
MISVQIHQNDISQINDLANWPRLGLDPNRGLLLIGAPGVGKTCAMKAFIKSQDRHMHSITAYDVEIGYKTKGLEYRSVHSYGSIYVDDIGIESTYILDFGSKYYPIQTFIFERHRRFVTDKDKFYGTTNLNFADLREKYGERVLDRLFEMVNFITVIGESYRYRI